MKRKEKQMKRIDSINIDRMDNGWIVRINGEDQNEDWTDIAEVVIGDDSDPLLQFLSEYVALPRRK
jgi:hypothetical protein